MPRRRKGDEFWQFRYPTDYVNTYGYNGGPRCSPLIDDDRVYLFGVEGMLYCVNANDGKVIWNIDTQKKFGVIQNFFGVGSNPVIEGDLLIVMVGGSPPENQQLPQGQLDQVVGNGTGIVAFDSAAAKYAISSPMSWRVTLDCSWRASRDSAGVLRFARGGLIGFEPVTGKLGFHFPSHEIARECQCQHTRRACG